MTQLETSICSYCIRKYIEEPHRLIFIRSLKDMETEIESRYPSYNRHVTEFIAFAVWDWALNNEVIIPEIN